TVAAHPSNGLPAFTILRPPEPAVNVSKDRIRSAFIIAGLEFPHTRHILINLAPADLPKSGARFDLAIAVGILAASGQLALDKVEGCEFLGELALSGELRPVGGVLPGVMACEREGRLCLLPAGNGPEAGLVRRARVKTAAHL